tara:strand:- start:702 stop:1715 length:1014 start_codon:yes stop_codon:yes gene_type:complete
MSYHVKILPSGKTFLVKPSQTILEAAISAGINIPYGCQNGSCGACKAKVINGNIAIDNYQRTVLSDTEKENGFTLCCKALALEDLVVETRESEVNLEDAPKISPVRVESLEKLNDSVMKMLLKLPGNEVLKFKAGQYIEFLIEGGARRAFSIASNPNDSLIELHLRLIEGGKFTHYVFEEMQEKSIHKIEAPIGQFYLRESTKPIIFVAGGTGFAPIKSIIEDIIRNKIKRPIYLYRGAREFNDLYMHNLCLDWVNSMDDFTYIPVSEKQSKECDDLRIGLVHKIVLEDFKDLENTQVYCCGSPGLVEVAFDDFVKKGLAEEEFFADAFTFAPQKNN